MTPEAEAAALAVVKAARRVLAGLNDRIDNAPADCVPVFDGIAELHDALTNLDKLP